MTGTMTRPHSETAVDRLSDTFETFNRVSSELAKAWRDLKEHAGRLDVQLDDVHRRLDQKEDEFDHLTTSHNAIVQSIPCGVVYMDRSGNILSVNPAMERIFRRSKNDWEGTHASSHKDIHGDPILLGAEGSAQKERTIYLSQEETIVIVSSVSDVSEPDGTISGKVEIVSDITEMAQLRQRLHRLDTLAALGEMAGAISHEIRTPLCGIEGFTRLLERSLTQPLSQDSTHYLSQIARGVKEVSHIVDRILAFANPGRLNREVIDPHALVTEFLDHNGFLDVRYECEGVERHIRGDRRLLCHALRNLLENAREAAKGTQIAINVLTDETSCRIEILDRGRGLDPLLKPKLFRPFVTSRPDGTGLGLAIVHRIIDLHGGSVYAEDRPGGGAVFTIILPLDPELSSEKKPTLPADQGVVC